MHSTLILFWQPRAWFSDGLLSPQALLVEVWDEKPAHLCINIKVELKREVGHKSKTPQQHRLLICRCWRTFSSRILPVLYNKLGFLFSSCLPSCRSVVITLNSDATASLSQSNEAGDTDRELGTGRNQSNLFRTGNKDKWLIPTQTMNNQTSLQTFFSCKMRKKPQSFLKVWTNCGLFTIHLAACVRLCCNITSQNSVK